LRLATGDARTQSEYLLVKDVLANNSDMAKTITIAVVYLDFFLIFYKYI